MRSIRDINVDIQGVNFVCRSCAVIMNENKILEQLLNIDNGMKFSTCIENI